MNGNRAIGTYATGRHLGVECEVPLWTTEDLDDDPKVTTHRTQITTLGKRVHRVEVTSETSVGLNGDTRISGPQE